MGARLDQIFRDLTDPQRWLFYFFLSITSAGLALSGASDWRTAGLLIGSGFGLDVLRWFLPLSRPPRNIEAEVLALAKLDASARSKQTRFWKLIMYPPMAAFAVVVALTLYFIAPVSVQDHTRPAFENLGQGWIMQLSRICRVFTAELSEHGLAGRAAEYQTFFGLTYGLFLVVVVLGCFAAARGLAREWAWRAYDRACRGLPAPTSFGPAILMLGFVVAMAFFAANNIEHISGSNPSLYRPMYFSGHFFLFYSFMLGSTSFSLVGLCSAAMLYGVRFNPKKAKQDAGKNSG